MDVRRIKKIPAKVFKYFENENIPFWTYIATFFSVIVIKQILESMSQKDKVFDSASFVVEENTFHFTLAYIAVVMALSIFIHFAASVSISKVCRVLLPGTIILLSAPLIDLVSTLGAGVNISYLQPGANVNLWRTYVTIGNGADGLSLGMRIEVTLLIFCFFYYFLTKNLPIYKSLVYAWLCYSVIFIWGMSPFIVTYILASLGFSGVLTEALMTKSFLFLLFFLVYWPAYLASPEVFLSIIRNLKISNIIFSVLAVLFGAAVASASKNYDIHDFIYRDQEVTISFIFALMAVIYVMLFAMLIDLIAEAGKDKYSLNADADSSTLKNLALIILSLALFYALFANAKAFLIIASMMSIIFIYYSKPFQIKRVPFLSGIALCSFALLAVFLGYVLIMKTSANFPLQLLWLYPVSMLATMKGGISWRKIRGIVMPFCNAVLLAGIIYLFW
ncbi:MAG TPA: hypothetical protein VL360_05320 [Gammaproteobacteria bacterium]|jgi:hypothetical protein|nr:hypothetical protein [Gammaproteobacteria bacterium]